MLLIMLYFSDTCFCLNTCLRYLLLVVLETYIQDNYKILFLTMICWIILQVSLPRESIIIFVYDSG
uniref:Uncharacterized protein n=1 Tax=Arundo donax TaxID=35708 RepID=A0A0A9F1Z4_ARUDO